MANGFSRGMWILLVLIFLVGVVLTYSTIRRQKVIADVVSVTDSRTEYLQKEVEDLKSRVQRLELRR